MLAVVVNGHAGWEHAEKGNELRTGGQGNQHNTVRG